MIVFCSDEQEPDAKESDDDSSELDEQANQHVQVVNWIG